MKIIIVGNLGYIGPVLARYMRRTYPNAVLVGVDSGYFATCVVPGEASPERHLDSQYFADVRDLPSEIFEGADAVVQLAALSNDPIGAEFADATAAINGDAALSAARAAKARGAKRFVFASSCSAYGLGGAEARKEGDALNPQTAYARSKIATEQGLEAIADDTFEAVCLRFATACGYSPRLRLDLVLNDFVATALTKGRIEILSDGSPWRPLIDVEDMARAIDWACAPSPMRKSPMTCVNVGSDAWNYQIKDLGQAVADALGGVELSINTDASPDTRSYRVDFGLYRALAPDHQPLKSLPQVVHELRDGLVTAGFDDVDFRKGGMMRLNHLRGLVAKGVLDAHLRWT